MVVVKVEGGGGWLQLVEEAAVQFQTEPDKAEFVSSLFGSLRPSERRSLSVGFQTPTD